MAPLPYSLLFVFTSVAEAVVLCDLALQACDAAED